MVNSRFFVWLVLIWLGFCVVRKIFRKNFCFKRGGAGLVF